MGYKNRELEIKLMPVGVRKLEDMNATVRSWVETLDVESEYLVGDATDLYWHAPISSEGDFVRLRRTSGSRAQITMKSTDTEDITNRVEIDLEVDDHTQAKVLCLGMFGKVIEKVRKKYYVYFLENDDTTISVYQVKGDKRVFIEVEARSKRRIRQLTQSLMEYCGDMEFVWIKSSIYNMFVEKAPAQVSLIDNFFVKGA